MSLEVDVLTLFPAIIEGPLRESIPGRILADGLATVRVHDLRRWGLGRHRSVDDAPYGGGPGMVMRVEPIAAALEVLGRPGSLVVLLDAAGEAFDQARAHELAERDHIVLVCGRYEGVDERVRGLVDLELSIGDYVLTGGELPALVVVDAVLRLLPGAIDAASTEEESFAAGLLEYPQYTRPPEFQGAGVPDVLVSGDHGQVRRWRLRESLRRTAERRPDLLEGRPLTPEERRLLDEVRDPTAPSLEADGCRRPAGPPDGRPAHRRPADPGGARTPCYTPPLAVPGGPPTDPPTQPRAANMIRDRHRERPRRDRRRPAPNRPA